MAKIGRNDPCTCGSGKKFKRCCEAKTSSVASRLMLITIGLALVGALVAGVASFTGTPSADGTRVWSPEHGHYHNAAGVQVP